MAVSITAVHFITARGMAVKVTHVRNNATNSKLCEKAELIAGLFKHTGCLPPLKGGRFIARVEVQIT